jgi:lactoylglutathione lyase
MKPELSLIVIKTKQLDLLKSFYEKIGLTFIEERHGTGPIHYSSSNKNLVLELYPLPKSIEVADTTTRLGFRVNNLDGIIKILIDSNTQIVSEPLKNEWGYSAIVKDPDGRSIELLNIEG